MGVNLNEYKRFSKRLLHATSAVTGNRLSASPMQSVSNLGQLPMKENLIAWGSGGGVLAKNIAQGLGK